MNPFANPADAVAFQFPEFPAPLKEAADFSGMKENQKFRDFEASRNDPPEDPIKIIQHVALQDFKDVLGKGAEENPA